MADKDFTLQTYQAVLNKTGGMLPLMEARLQTGPGSPSEDAKNMMDSIILTTYYAKACCKQASVPEEEEKLNEIQAVLLQKIGETNRKIVDAASALVEVCLRFGISEAPTY